MKNHSFETGFIRKDIYQNRYEFIAYDNLDELFTCISRIYCWSDCDDTFRIVGIFVNGHEVEYVGWQPLMHYEYRFIESKELCWEGWFPNWEH